MGLVHESVLVGVVLDLNVTARWDKAALHLSDMSILKRRLCLTLVDLGKFLNSHSKVPASVLVHMRIVVDKMT